MSRIREPIQSRGDPLASAKLIVNGISQAVDRTLWSDHEIQTQFGRRSAREVLNLGETCYMNPCLDLSLVALEALNRAGYRTTLAIEELTRPEYDFHRMHFGVEFDEPPIGCFLDFSAMNNVLLKRGNYFNSRTDVHPVRIVRVSGTRFDPKKPLHANLGFNSPEGLMERFLQDCTLESQIQQLVADNSTETYQNYLAALNGDKALRLKYNPTEF